MYFYIGQSLPGRRTASDIVPMVSGSSPGLSSPGGSSPSLSSPGGSSPGLSSPGQSSPGLPAPALPMRGTVEGFYGPPWTHADRLAHLEFSARVGLNIYVYAPKDD